MSSGVGGAGQLGAGRSPGDWLALQAGAGPDPARGGAVPGYGGGGSSGAGAWFAGLLVLVAVPGVNLVLGPVVMMVAGLRGSRGLLEPERTNRCRAASWGLTFLLGEVLLIGAQLYIVQVVFGAGGVGRCFRGVCRRCSGWCCWWLISWCVSPRGSGPIVVGSPVSEGSPFFADRQVLMDMSLSGFVVTMGCGMWRRALG